MSAVSKTSLTPTGTPCSGPMGLPWRRHSSATRACARAWSGSRNAHAWTCPSTSRIRARQASTNCSELMMPPRIIRAASDAESEWSFVRSIRSAVGAGLKTHPYISLAIQKLRQPKRHARPDVHEREADADDDHVGHHAGEDLIERDVFRRHGLQIERGHRHGRRQECRLEIDCHHGAEEDRVDLKVAEKWDEDRAENDNDLGPLEWPAEEENDHLRHELESQRR